MSRVLNFFKNLLLIYISNCLLYINNKHLLSIMHYEMYNTKLVSNLIIKRRLSETLMYNKRSQLKVSNINNYNDDHEENKNSLTEKKEMLKTSNRNENNRKSKKRRNYDVTKKKETAKLVLEALDNIFIDKVTDTNIHEEYSELEEEVFENAIILSSSSMIFAIPIFSYICKRINFFDSPQ
ncbi:hypothetical protein C923_04280 [Plasmodium falciparum UGT5.1]|uniref:Uncharacterized protein n=4 Tax=Plasmodium falciparum TaxID=5833 RepID=W7K3A0_PLAFO|nr:hypothetical protein PFMALIP_04082 [Plasmodium falciparum MaliPS096_E11]EUR67461.1 hypothetical protein PFBG_04141 [Plasmodium falciparum 7G8]EWC75051.1 hypothetical protein C923_04280 [Plasmodium falciparum UGT5.1]EWC87270.1 hypothetical protein PFNF54_04047 [Plasmodium falciparum NF54]